MGDARAFPRTRPRRHISGLVAGVPWAGWRRVVGVWWCWVAASALGIPPHHAFRRLLLEEGLSSARQVPPPAARSSRAPSAVYTHTLCHMPHASRAGSPPKCNALLLENENGRFRRPRRPQPPASSLRPRVSILPPVDRATAMRACLKGVSMHLGVCVRPLGIPNSPWPPVSP